MLTRADLRDSDKNCRHVRRPLTMPTQEYLVSTRFVLTFLLYLACHGRGARQPKAAAMLAELFVASIGQVPKGVCLTTMVPTAGVERTNVELCASLADSGTSVVVDGSVEVLRALGSRSKANELVQFLKCCHEAEDEGVQLATVAMLVLGLASVVDNWFATFFSSFDPFFLIKNVPFFFPVADDANVRDVQLQLGSENPLQDIKMSHYSENSSASDRTHSAKPSTTP